jgi:hypothetical protein
MASPPAWPEADGLRFARARDMVSHRGLLRPSRRADTSTRNYRFDLYCLLVLRNAPVPLFSLSALRLFFSSRVCPRTVDNLAKKRMHSLCATVWSRTKRFGKASASQVLVNAVTADVTSTADYVASSSLSRRFLPCLGSIFTRTRSGSNPFILSWRK